MDPRKLQVFKSIIEHFIETAQPVGSRAIIINYHINVSPATVRNDMVYLEKEGLISQPYTSAGRIPTTEGYRLYVDEIANKNLVRKKALQHLANIRKAYEERKAKQKIYDAVSLLAQAVNNISFATLPENNRTFYLGLSQTLKQPEFQREPMQASQVVEVLEEGSHFIKTLKSLDIDNEVRIFIGKENIIDQIKSCSLITTKYTFREQEGFIGILGPTRMNYPFNCVVLEEIKRLLEE